MKNLRIILGMILEFLVIGFCAFLLGCGLGFLQGVIVFCDARTDIKLGLSGWAAIIGGVISLAVSPWIYYLIIKGRFTVVKLAEMIAIIGAIGIGSAFFLTKISDGGWLSWLVTVASSIIVSYVYRSKSKKGENSKEGL